MLKKVLLVVLSVLLAATVMTGCGNTPSENNKQVQTESTKSYPPIDLNPREALSISPEGIKAVAPSALSLTNEEIEQLKKGKYKVAFSYHTLSDQCNQRKLAAAKEALASWGIDVVSVTAAEFKAEAQVSDIESALALKPDVLFVMPVDPHSVAGALEKVKGTKTKIVFMENVAAGYKAGVDYLGSASSDSYGNGKAAADIMAQQLGYKGKVAMMFYDMDYFVTNERDRGFRETIKNNYPNIEIVMEAGFTNVNNTGAVADAIFAKYPDINGIYATWDVPAEGAIASARSLGRNDVIITTCDLGDNAARLIAEDGMIRGTGAPRSAEQGKAEALIAAYGLLGKKLPSTFVTPPALPVVKANVLEAYKMSYGVEAPQALVDIVKQHKNN